MINILMEFMEFQFIHAISIKGHLLRRKMSKYQISKHKQSWQFSNNLNSNTILIISIPNTLMNIKRLNPNIKTARGH